MKRYILLVGLYLFIASLMAATGLFDLSYGQDLAEAHTALLAKGFKETERDEMSVAYTNDRIPGLIDLELLDVFDVGTISSWTAHYNVKDNAGLTQKMLSDLKAIHEKEPFPSDSNDRWTWDLGSTYSLNMTLSEDQATLSVEYVDSDEGWYWEEIFDWLE